MKKALLISVAIDGHSHEVGKLYKILHEKYGYRMEDIFVYCEGAGCSREPTYTNIMKILQDFASLSSSCDELWIYYSGHGIENGLVMSDQKLITKQLIHRILYKIKCPCFILLDCCHSGQFASLLEWNYTFDGGQTHVHPWTITNPNIYMLCSCSSTELSANLYHSIDNIHIGAFTMAFCAILDAASYSIDLDELFENVCFYMKTFRGLENQKPIMGSSGNEIRWNFLPCSQPEDNNKKIQSNFLGLVGKEDGCSKIRKIKRATTRVSFLI